MATSTTASALGTYYHLISKSVKLRDVSANTHIDKFGTILPITCLRGIYVAYLSPTLLLYQPNSHCLDSSLGSVRDTQFSNDILHVFLHRVLSNVKFLSYLLVCLSLSERH